MSEAVLTAVLGFCLIHSGKAMDCFATTNNRMVQTTCGAGEKCCGSQCCPVDGDFYTHWYFWLAVSMFLALILGFAVSACRHFRRERKYRHYFLRASPKLIGGFFGNYYRKPTITAGVVSLPLYEELAPVTGGFLAPPPPGAPPAYSDIHQPGRRWSSSLPPLPPSYSQAVMADEAGRHDAHAVKPTTSQATSAPTVA